MYAIPQSQSILAVMDIEPGLANAETFRQQFGLFLDDDHDSEIEVITSDFNNLPCYNVPIHIDQRKAASGMDSLVSDSRCPSPEKALGGNLPLDSGYHRTVLKHLGEVYDLFTNRRRRLTILHIGQEHSYAPLRITRACFETLIQCTRTFPAIKDSILHIGFRDMEREVAPPVARSRVIFGSGTSGSIVDGFETVYGLRFVELNGRPRGKPWSLRQCVVHNQTRFSEHSSHWTFFCLPEVLRTQIEICLGLGQQELILHPFDLHLVLLSTAVKMWRPYFIHYTEAVEECRRKVCMAEPRDHDSLEFIHSDMLLVLKNYENDILDAMLAIRATKNTATAHQSLYNRAQNPECGIKDTTHICSPRNSDAAGFDCQEELSLLSEQAQTLLEKIRSVSGTVASILGLANGYSLIANSHSLEVLTRQSQQENQHMMELTYRAGRDAKAVKALSVITLTYLPITVVLNFFSTTFVSADQQGLHLARRWWLLFAISAPLTVFTLFVWGIWVCTRSRVPQPDTEDLRSAPQSAGASRNTSRSSEQIWKSEAV